MTRFLSNIFRPRPSSRFINLNRAINGVDLWISESDLATMPEVKRVLDQRLSAGRKTTVISREGVAAHPDMQAVPREEFKRQWNQLVEGMRI